MCAKDFALCPEGGGDSPKIWIIPALGYVQSGGSLKIGRQGEQEMERLLQ